MIELQTSVKQDELLVSVHQNRGILTSLIFAKFAIIFPALTCERACSRYTFGRFPIFDFYIGIWDLQKKQISGRCGQVSVK